MDELPRDLKNPTCTYKKLTFPCTFTGGIMDAGPAGRVHWLCVGAIQEIPTAVRCAAQLPQDRAVTGHTQRGRTCCVE